MKSGVVKINSPHVIFLLLNTHDQPVTFQATPLQLVNVQTTPEHPTSIDCLPKDFKEQAYRHLNTCLRGDCLYRHTEDEGNLSGPQKENH